jgi:carbon storage regulator
VVNRRSGSADQFVPATSEAELGWRVRAPLLSPRPTGDAREGAAVLTLTRVVGEKIVIGDDLVLNVLSVSENGRVRLGIEAPRQIRIDREEVLERIRKDNPEAGGPIGLPCLRRLCGTEGE